MNIDDSQCQFLSLRSINVDKFAHANYYDCQRKTVLIWKLTLRRLKESDILYRLAHEVSLRKQAIAQWTDDSIGHLADLQQLFDVTRKLT